MGAHENLEQSGKNVSQDGLGSITAGDTVEGEKTMSTLKEMIDKQKKVSFVPDYVDKATDEEALGLIVSNYFQWDGLAILKTLSSALEDANFHTENEKIQAIIDELEKGAA